jgi:hypothetical protein
MDWGIHQGNYWKADWSWFWNHQILFQSSPQLPESPRTSPSNPTILLNSDAAIKPKESAKFAQTNQGLHCEVRGFKFQTLELRALTTKISHSSLPDSSKLLSSEHRVRSLNLFEAAVAKTIPFLILRNFWRNRIPFNDQQGFSAPNRSHCTDQDHIFTFLYIHWGIHLGNYSKADSSCCWNL